MKVRDVLRLLKDKGWYLVHQRGSHKQFKHPIIPGKVTIAGHDNDDIPPGTLNNILIQMKVKGGI
ncbi:MAG: type II toxin-antitoxin system HicA family toxin [Candidatus Atribacteria bacterium]|nr:type II toxin-antitoxin system HicA family toxin [Candidatus Atribacteria bacterium]